MLILNKMQMIGQPWQSPMCHLLLVPITVISECCKEETKKSCLSKGSSWNQEASGRGKPNAKVTKQLKAKP